MDQDAATLNDLQDKLLDHFHSLAEVRKQSRFPIFALEHGLPPDKIEVVRKSLRELPLTRYNSKTFWLLWVIYACEAGYDYTGDEYWPSFEKKTPNWQNQYRCEITRWFCKFQKEFNGVEPSGPWAERFRIIAWPITHALLPRYLQNHLVNLLYELRFLLVNVTFEVESIGRLLATHAISASSRFENFLEQKELTGQIVAALLGAESKDTDKLIYLPTLKRIVSALRESRSSRAKLKETKNVVSDRFQGIPTSFLNASIGSNRTTIPKNLSCSIRPNLFLRHNTGRGWSALLQFKSLRPITTQSPELSSFLASTRCCLNGASDWKPTGWLLSGNRLGVLHTWPNTDIPLIQFERSDCLLDQLLDSDFRLKTGPIWLFRINADGIAYHINSLTVRPTKKYLVVTTDSLPSNVPNSISCNLNCSNVNAFRFDVPGKVSAELTKRYLELGVKVARTIRIWPAGLPGRGWDHDGNSEWLTTEQPCFGIAPDHPIDSFSFRLNDESEQIVNTEPSNDPLFVKLPCLSPGEYKLNIEARRSPKLDNTITTSPAKGLATLVVRDPTPWTPGVASHSGMIVTCDPFNADLDLLWRNQLKLSVIGPEAFSVKISLKLFAADETEILSVPVNNSMTLPITTVGWHKTFDKFLENEDLAWKYIDAASCTLDINGGSLGTCLLSFDRRLSPLRWTLSYQKPRMFLRLTDDRGHHDTKPEVLFFSMNNPLKSLHCDTESAKKGFEIPPPGGLYQAIHKSYKDAAIVSPQSRELKDFKDFGVDLEVKVSDGAAMIQKTLRILHLWTTAKRAGSSVNYKCNQIARGIFDAVFLRVCGNNWTKAEENFKTESLSSKALKTLENLVDKRSNFGQSLCQQININKKNTIAEQFTAIARNSWVSNNSELCQFSLHIADRQSHMLADDLIDSLIKQLVDNPALLRGARLVSLLREHDSHVPM